MNNALDRKLVGQAVYEKLRNDIVTGHLKPEQKLKLNQLKETYNVSVNTLRETLMRLVAEGFVSFEDQKGFRVIPVSIADLEELIELRGTLEMLGLEKSFERRDTLIDWKSRLISAHFRLSCAEKLMMEDEAQHVTAWEKADRDFHTAIVSNCGSKQLIRYHASVIELYMRYQVLALSQRPFRGKEVMAEHQELVQRLLDDDIEGAKSLLSLHISRGSQTPKATV
ncbi:GntR family transcriptional regulator [Neptunomonas phycophila]|jgi:DNA-binding GntR family transcriptional regulator|uniref:GntR family transcriptional regulator n=1 Tax=Neptunomonas phycophila TaxID=1572645 RepID=A0ABT9EUI4_9GAMM|nr:MULTISPECIES: GntR family transcriptional regulator [Neptunomonas]MDN2658851.1 GntR family transcriptional regulator [Neptunomonas sp. CHC150]MDO6468955.1 GntR family transcriptional regulator [Neptunomonas phycophila]MDP2522725.1 GntR family transcriptional regulator [Neptunomonas phycophila]QLE97216.1 GntR family transcriptional regulator [Neptunomonas phycophila]